MSESGIQIKIVLALAFFIISLVQADNEEAKAFALSDLLDDNSLMKRQAMPSTDEESNFARSLDRRFAFAKPIRGDFAFAFAKRNFQNQFGNHWQFAKKSSFA